MAAVVRAPVYLIFAAAVCIAAVVVPPVVTRVAVAVVMPRRVRAAAVLGTCRGTGTIAARLAQPLAVILMRTGMTREQTVCEGLHAFDATEEQIATRLQFSIVTFITDITVTTITITTVTDIAVTTIAITTVTVTHFPVVAFLLCVHKTTPITHKIFNPKTS